MNIKRVLLLSLGHLSCDVNSGALPALLPYLAAVHHLDYQTCGMLTFTYAAMSSIIQPLLGWIADKKRCNIYIPLGIIMAGCGMAAVGFINSIWGILAALAVCGTGGALFHPEGARYASLISEKHKGIGVSIFAIGGNSGFAVGPLIVALFVGGTPLPLGIYTGGFGLHGTFIFAFFSIVAAILLYINISRWDIELTVKKKQNTQILTNDWKAFAVLSICIITRSAAFSGFTSFVPLYWQNEFHTSAEIGGLALAAFCTCGVICNLIGGYISDRIGPKRTMCMGLSLATPFILLFGFQHNPYIAFILLLVSGVGLYIPFSSVILLGQKYLAKNMGFASGITLGVAVSVGGMFIPILGWIADNYGGLPTAMKILGIFALIGTVASFFLKPETYPQRSDIK